MIVRKLHLIAVTICSISQNYGNVLYILVAFLLAEVAYCKFFLTLNLQGYHGKIMDDRKWKVD